MADQGRKSRSTSEGMAPTDSKADDGASASSASTFPPVSNQDRAAALQQLQQELEQLQAAAGPKASSLGSSTNGAGAPLPSAPQRLNSSQMQVLKQELVELQRLKSEKSRAPTPPRSTNGTTSLGSASNGNVSKADGGGGGGGQARVEIVPEPLPQPSNGRAVPNNAQSDGSRAWLSRYSRPAPTDGNDRCDSWHLT